MITFGDYVTFVINCFLIFIILLILYFFVGVIYTFVLDKEFYTLAILLVFSGITLIGLQIYFEINMRFDDKYFGKKDSEDVTQELKAKRDNEGRLSLWESSNLRFRIFIHKWYIFKLGAILVCMGIILAIVLFLL